MAKSLLLTYLLWLFGGFFGLHHFYLGRDFQAFLWWCFPGGYFGAGWIRDLWRIPEYVKDANNDPAYVKWLTERMKVRPSPPISLVRLIGQLFVGNAFGMLVTMAIPGPDEIGWDLSLVGEAIAPAATALGIWLVGNIGREEGSIKYPLFGCYMAAPFFMSGHLTYIWITICGMVGFHVKSRAWRRHVRDRGAWWKRALCLLMCGCLYISLFCSHLYFNMRITTQDGDDIKFRDALGNFLKSPAVQEFSNNLHKLKDHAFEFGIWSAMQQFIDSLDPLGEKNALKVLALDPGASQDAIRSRYRELSKKWHPDKFSGDQEKSVAHERFLEIQQAYEVLSQIKARRKLRSSVPDSQRAA